MRQPVIYIAGPYRGNNESDVLANILRAREYAIEVWKHGGVALCPHLNTALMGGLISDGTFLDGDIELLSRCDALYLIRNSESSWGTQAELRFATEGSIPVLRDSVDVIEFLAEYAESHASEEMSQP